MFTIVIAVAGAGSSAALVASARRTAVSGHLRTGAPRRWRVPARLRAPLERALEEAAVRHVPEEVVELWAVAVLAVVVACTAVAPALLPFALGAALVAGPVALRLARSRREARFTAELPGALEDVASVLRGGGTVAHAVEHLADGDAAVADDFSRIRARTALGSSFADALARWSEEHTAVGVRESAGALAVAASLGGGSADAIDGLARSLRLRLDAAADARALSAQARASAVVVGAAPVGYLLFSSMLDAGAVGSLLGTSVGRTCLGLGLALEAVAALWIRRIMRSEP